MKGKNRLVPRLLGVTKDSVLRLDENSKQILKTWPLTTVRRWAASPNVFTLDFGDYQACQTSFFPIKKVKKRYNHFITLGSILFCSDN